MFEKLNLLKHAEKHQLQMQAKNRLAQLQAEKSAMTMMGGEEEPGGLTSSRGDNLNPDDPSKLARRLAKGLWLRVSVGYSLKAWGRTI
jgi:hypothetical protein